MKHIFILILIGVAVLGAGIGAYIMNTQTPQQTTMTTTQEQQYTTTTQQPQQTTTTPGETGTPTNTIDLSGTWRGTFTASKWPGGSQGRWEWIIYKTGDNEYKGYIKVMDVYPTNGYIPITVSLNGNKITVGTVAGVVVVFTGTVSSDGRSAQGTWKFSNNQDSGTWSGTKVSSETTVPETTTTTTTETAETTTTTTSQETSNTGASGARCGLVLDKQLAQVYDEALNIFTNVFGSEPKCTASTMLNQQSYVFQLQVDGLDEAKINDYLTGLTTALQAQGYTVRAAGQNDNEITVVTTKVVDGVLVNLNIVVDISGSEGQVTFQLIKSS